MIDEQRLREGLQRLLRDTEAAIRDRISDEPSIEAQLRERHASAVQAGRTAGSALGYNSFADEAITQAAVHWLLGCVFVRFLEDNGWLDERYRVISWLAGPGERLAIAGITGHSFCGRIPRSRIEITCFMSFAKWRSCPEWLVCLTHATIRSFSWVQRLRVLRRSLSSSRRWIPIPVRSSTISRTLIMERAFLATSIRTFPTLPASDTHSARRLASSSTIFWTVLLSQPSIHSVWIRSG